MWLHIRGVGEWTNRLYSYFEEEQQKLQLLNEDLPGSANSKSSNADAMESSKIKKLQSCVYRVTYYFVPRAYFRGRWGHPYPHDHKIYTKNIYFIGGKNLFSILHTSVYDSPPPLINSV